MSKKWFARTAASGVLAGLISMSAVAAVASVPDIMLNNDKLRFGGGGQASSSFTYVDSVATNGMLEQPFYKSSDGNWYKLTYNTYGLNMTLGSGTGGANWSGATVPTTGDFSTQGITSLNNLAVDASGVTLRSPAQAVDYGYGTLVVTGDVTLNGASVGVSNTYVLGQNASFVKITSAITNNDASAIDNVHIWVGTQDDFVGTSDGPTKTRGNLVGGSFEALTDATASSNAIQITSAAEGVLFYSTSPGVDTSISNCCLFGNAVDQDPDSAAITETGDGSYAAILPVGNLAAGATTSITWYYAAGAIADLGVVAQEVAAAAGSSGSSGSSEGPVGIPGITLTVAGPVGREILGSPVYYGADRVAVTSTYLLTVTKVSNAAPSVTTLAEGTIDADGSFSSMVRLPYLEPGTYNVRMVGTHVNGATLQLTSQVTVDGGVFTSIGANIPVIR